MNPILLDTHALVWWLAGGRRLPASTRRRIADPEQTVLVSAASAWEVSIKRSLGKLRAPDGLIDIACASGFDWIAIEPMEAEAAGQLPMHHRDPFDRLLAAQALARSAALVSRDEVFDRYGVERLWS